MNRADGYRIESNDYIYQAIPHVMDRRYDASNYMDLEIDIDSLQSYINGWRKKGVGLSYMAVIIAAYIRTAAKYPYLNRFIMNKRIYARNHFSITFVTLKAGEMEETAVKLYFNLDEDIFEINQKINDAIEFNRKEETANSTDKLLKVVFRIPGLVRGVVNLLKFVDKHFTLPFFLIDAIPFHTSFFITNLASIRLNSIYHHIYEFGTTSIFLSMGQTTKKVVRNGDGFTEKKVMPMKIVTDERIASGNYYGKCFREFQKYMANPELLETKAETINRDPDIIKKNPKFFVKEKFVKDEVKNG